MESTSADQNFQGSTLTQPDGSITKEASGTNLTAKKTAADELLSVRAKKRAKYHGISYPIHNQ